MEMRIAGHEGVFTASLFGQLWNRQETGSVEARLVGLAEEKARCVVIDLSRLTFIDSAGVGCLVRVYARLKEHGIRALLYRPLGSVRETLDLLGVGSFLTMAADDGELAEALQNPDLGLD